MNTEAATVIEQTCFFQESLYVLQTDTNFPGELIERTCFLSICSSNNPHYLIEQILIFSKTFIYTSNTYEFSRSLYFPTEQIFIFQEVLSSPRTHTISRRTPYPMLKQIGIFQKGTPCRTYISLIGLGGCFRMDKGNPWSYNVIFISYFIYFLFYNSMGNPTCCYEVL